MRRILTIVLTSILLASSCSSPKDVPPEGYKPNVGQVLAATDGGSSVVISLGTEHGVRPGDSLVVMRGTTRVGEIIIHEARGTQSAGQAVGGSGAGDIAKGDTVLAK